MADVDDGHARATVEGTSDGSGTARLRIEGDLDLSTVGAVERDLEPFLAASPSCVVFDMAHVSFIDSSGIAMVLRAAARVPRVEVHDPSPSVQLILSATGLAETLHVTS